MICWTWATATFFCLLSSIQYVDHASELLVIIDTGDQFAYEQLSAPDCDIILYNYHDILKSFRVS